MDKLLVSHNLTERLEMGLPLDKAFAAGRLTAIWSAIADLGCCCEKLPDSGAAVQLSEELTRIAEALDTLNLDVLKKGGEIA